MTYAEAVDTLFTQLPMFQRQGPAAYKADLDGTWRVLEMLDRPDVGLQVVHVAGTNGKGTVCHLVAAALQTAGYRVGLFTSPHLVDFRERIRVNGECISEAAVTAFVEHYREDWKPIQPSFFELTFGMALAHFKASAVDVVVLETGMGGRLDSTNVFPKPLVTAVTNVGWDHQQFLGQTIRDIAHEKAGIVKDGCPVVVGRMRPEALSVVHEHALRRASEVYSADLESEPPAVSAVFAENRATARAVCRVLAALPGWHLPPSAIATGFEGYARMTGQRGRFEWLQPTANGARVLADCAHNYDGLTALVRALDDLPHEQLHVVYGTVADKDMAGIWPILPAGTYYWCAANIPRARPADDLAAAAVKQGLQGTAYPSVQAAYQGARTAAGPSDLVLVTGSIFTVGEALPAERFTP
jgi:dihydrofolate synthase/folylpolyglutamate synthase